MNSDFKELLQIFNANDVDYLIVGGYAVIEYTEPRYTKDFDVWVRAEAENAQRVYRSLAQFGAPLESMNAADFAEEGFVFQIGVAPVRIDILMSVSGVSFSEAWPNRTSADFDGTPGWIISRADLLRTKRAEQIGPKICLISPVLKPSYHCPTYKNSRPVHQTLTDPNRHS